MSLWNHFANYSDFVLKSTQALAARQGQEFPDPPADINTFARDWCTRGWFPWERDGWPFWSQLHVMQSWWGLRSEPNVLLLNYAGMLADPPGTVRRIADFLGIEVADERIASVAAETSFSNMKRKGETYVPHGGISWKDGARTFFHKGTNGRWRKALTEENLFLYDAACARALTPDCRAWLENPDLHATSASDR